MHVSQICKVVGISKVTFFKYFPQKEDILLYFFRVWTFHRAVELSRVHRKGVEGIQFLFDRIGESFESHPGMFLGLISYLSRQEMPIRPFPLKPAERVMLYPDIENITSIELLSLDQLFENFLLEAIFRNEITKTGDMKQLVYLLDTIWYGAVVTNHVKQAEVPTKILMRQNLKILMDGLKRQPVAMY